MDATVTDRENASEPAESNAARRPEEVASTYAALGAELREYVAYYAAVRIDQMRLAAGRALIAALAIAASLLVAAGSVLTATALVVIGAAQGLAAALGGQTWQGNVLAGLAVLTIAAIGLALAIYGGRRLLFHRFRVKYEERRDEQYRQFGRDLAGRR
jgi:hypothetical protein